MPWVNKENCTGCGICVGICPVDAIVLDDCSAVIDMRGCIRCGQCHDACPENAVRHDSERIPIEVAGNVKRAREIMASCREHLGKGQEQNCLERTIRHFRKERKVIDATLDELTNLLEMQGTQ